MFVGLIKKLIKITILNQASTRYNFIRFWNNHWSLYKNFNYIFFSFTEKVFNRYLRFFFRLVKFFKASLIFSNIKILRTILVYHIYLFFYDSAFYDFKRTYALDKKKFYWKKYFLIDLKTGLIHYYNKNFFLNYNFIIASFFSSFFSKDRKNPFFFDLTMQMKKKKILKTLYKIIFFCMIFIFNETAKKEFFQNRQKSERFSYQRLTKNYILKHLQLFNIRKRIYSVIYRFPRMSSKEQKLIKFLIYKQPVALSTKNLNLISYATFLSNIFVRFNYLKTAINLKLVNLRKYIRPINLFCHLIAQRICLLGRPRDRRNKLTTAFFMPVFNYIQKDRTVAGFRLLVSGRINRRGRAMWKRFNFKRIPRGIFSLGVDFLSQQIKTVNGILTIKVFLFRPLIKFLTEVCHKDFILFSPHFFINRNFFSFKLSNLKFIFLKNLLRNKLIVKQRLNIKRRTRKMIKQLIRRNQFAIL
jgi:hypothetical protein